MKKLLAMLMALVMVFTCAAALAEEAALPTGTLSKIDLVVDRDFVTAYAAMMDEEGSNVYANLAATVLDILDQVSLYVTAGENTAEVELSAGDTRLTSLQCVADDNSVTVVSELFPHYAINVTMDQMVELMQNAVTINGKQVSPEELEALVTQLASAVGPYVEDLMAYAETLSEKIEMSEDGSSMHLILTTHEVADVLELVVNRLSGDEVLLPYLQTALQQNDQAATAEEALAKVREQIAALRAADPEQVVEAALTMQEDGSVNIEADFSSTMMLSIDIYEEEGARVVDALTLVCEDGTDDWSAVYEGIKNGTSDDVAVDTRVKTYVDDSDGSDNVFVYVEVMTGGMQVIASGLVSVVGEGTPDFYCYTNFGIDLGMTEDDIAAIVAHTIYADAPEAPSLEGLTVVNAITMSEEEQQGLMEDVMGYGLPALMSAAQQALPDQLATIIQMLPSGE